MSFTAPAAVPAFSGWRTTIIALACALIIGGVGGLIGLGGGEFRLPVLVGFIGFTARAAVPMNQVLSLVTLVTALVVRWHAGSLAGVGVFAPAVSELGLGGITAAWFAVRLLSRVSDHRLERAIAILLMAIGALLIGERFMPVGLPPLVPAEPVAQLVVGIFLGLRIGTASTRTAGSAVLFVSIPTVCVGLFRYGRIGLLPSRSTLLRIAMGSKASSARQAVEHSRVPHRPSC